MRILLVKFQIKPEFRDQFIALGKLDADGSANTEPGCRRFDFLEDERDPNTFYFYEVYDDEDAFKAHQATPHFAKYRATLQQEWLAAPSSVAHCVNIFPSDAEWK
ncbi:MAG: putative quinol monooxygenase [Anaerolineae bacterium]|jgi:autoinducer 2-degrading protein